MTAEFKSRQNAKGRDNLPAFFIIKSLLFTKSISKFFSKRERVSRREHQIYYSKLSLKVLISTLRPPRALRGDALLVLDCQDQTKTVPLRPRLEAPAVG
jgi:hypothetical protein